MLIHLLNTSYPKGEKIKPGNSSGGVSCDHSELLPVHDIGIRLNGKPPRLACLLPEKSNVDIRNSTLTIEKVAGHSILVLKY